MPRKLSPEMTFDDLEDEILFTRATLKSDPNAKSVLSLTDTWMGMVDEGRAYDRTVREKVADIDGQRVVANKNLDVECTAFGDDLYTAVRKDRTSPRWTQFFSTPVSTFIKLALSRQVSQVRGWLGSASDPVLETHRANLDLWSGAARTALDNTDGLATLRGQNWQKRYALTGTLTTLRDTLHDTLSQIAREQGLPRDWADAFFRTTPSSASATPPTAPGEQAPAGG